eukprot:SAG31_NODE_4905_length_2875_cov_2.277017_3_plen_129_part_00
MQLLLESCGRIAVSVLPIAQAVVWNHTVDGPSGGSATIDPQGNVYIGSWDKHLYKVRSSISLWHLAIRDTCATTWPSAERSGLQLDGLTGQLIWKFNTSGSVESHPAYCEGVVYVSAEESKTLCAVRM